MKTLRSLTPLAVLGLLAASCTQDPQSANGPAQPLWSSTNPAHPALAYGHSDGSGYMNLSVADSDGTNQAVIFNPHHYTVWQGYVIGGQSWSPTGGSIAFVSSSNTGIGDTLHTIDVSVNSHGAPVGSNLKKIYVFPTGGGFKAPTAWSSTTTMGKIAFWEYDGSYTWKLKVIPKSGGSATTIYTSSKRLLGVTWNSDDSRLATIRLDSSAGFTVMIFNTSTWAEVDSIAVYDTLGHAKVATSLEWSRSGLNKLAMVIYNQGVGAQLFYCSPTTGATPTTDGIYSTYAPDGSNLVTWSPNNSSVMYPASGGLSKVSTGTTDTSLVTSSLGAVKWKP